MKSKYIVQGALIAAIYMLLTWLIAPIGTGLWQCRISEALCILPYFTPAAVPGLFIGCLLANLLTGAVIYDVVFGSLATLLAAVLTYFIRRVHGNRWWVPLPAVLVNALVIGALMVFAYYEETPFWLCALLIGGGQAVACYGLGMPLLMLLQRYQDKIFAP